jgi:hypothetical protein
MHYLVPSASRSLRAAFVEQDMGDGREAPTGGRTSLAELRHINVVPGIPEGEAG